ncbi:MAG TPA: 6-phosphofructokinase [Planctomycetota bacterium]|nr:6-phosphofructokinase [Planctomycetota bacterium]
MKIGLLTGGGDCPGLNAVIRAVVKRAEQGGDEVLGIRNGWNGLLSGNVEPLTPFSVMGILPKGGTILGTSRTNPFKSQEGVQKSLDFFRKYGLDALIAVGGEDTLGVAERFHANHSLPVVGVPKTIDNDLAGTDSTFGFDTAVNVVMEAIDRLHSTAESHHRIMVVEVMGRDSGWIATLAGLAGGADYVIVPERPYDIKDLAASLARRRERGRQFSIIVVAEGAKPKGGGNVSQQGGVDEFGHVRLGGVGQVVAEEISKATGFETRVTILGHVQRGGSPSAFDRVLGTRFGLRAVDLVRAKSFGRMVALSGTKIIDVPLPPPGRQKRYLDMELYADAETFFG